MKKINFLPFLLVFAFIFINAENNYAQQVNKNYVVVEIGTGTWCTYCPGAALGADDLVENGHQVAIIENHNGDSYTWAGSNARNSYYGITGYPTAVFNGGNNLAGGSHTETMYDSYVPLVNSALSVMSDFSLDMSYTRTGADFDVAIDVDEVGDYTGTNLVIHLFMTESHIQENWQGQTELNFVNRAMYPNQTGTAYTGDATTLNLSFTADAAWDLDNCELVAFVQDISSKEVLQSRKIALAPAVGVNNIELVHAVELAEPCFGVVNPVVVVKNLGSEEITSLTVNYSINGGATTGTLNWAENPIAFYHYTQLSMGEIAFGLEASNTIEFEITEVNGVTDDDPSDNVATTSFNESPESVDNTIHLELHTDAYGDECTWTITDYSGAIIESGGPYGNFQTINETFMMPGGDCYSFNIIDSFGDGGGAITLTDDNSNVLYSTNGTYGAGESQAYKTPGAGASVNDTAFSNSLIYPNPANSTLQIDNANGLNLSIFDLLGRELVAKVLTTSEEQINVSELAEGTYVVQLTDGVSARTEKIVITR